MPSFFANPILPPRGTLAPAQPSAVDRWHAAAEADYEIARQFADRFGAALARTEQSQRVGWDRDGRRVYGVLLPDPLPSAHAAEADWYIYYVWGETLFRRTAREREKLGMLVLPSGAEDWAELLRQAVRRDVFDVRWEVTPQYVNALGEVDAAPSGCEFALSACAPPGAATSALRLLGTGETPDAAARNACLRWLRKGSDDVAA